MFLCLRIQNIIQVLDDFVLEFSVKSLLGNRTKIKDLPKLTSLISSRLRGLFVQYVVHPKKMKYELPKPDEVEKKEKDEKNHDDLKDILN